MNVVWKYLDKRAGAVSALKDFGSMKFIVENTDDEIKAAYDKMSSCRGVRYVLDTFYCKDNEYGSSVVDGIAEHFHIERASAYRRKNHAIEKLTFLLFGKP